MASSGVLSRAAMSAPSTTMTANAHVAAPRQPSRLQPAHGRARGWLARGGAARSPRRRVAAADGAGSNLIQRVGRMLRDRASGNFDRVLHGAAKTRERLGLVDGLLSSWSTDEFEDQLEELEEVLITADFGPKTALKIVGQVRDSIKKGTVKTGPEVRKKVQQCIVDLLEAKKCGPDLKLTPSTKAPAVVLVVGVNGAGKTTTIGKLASMFTSEGTKVLLVPGDTFRAAASAQLAEWAKRCNATLGTFKEGAKPQLVVQQNLETAAEQMGGHVDLVVVDTAGRLHTAYALMEELQAVHKAIGQCTPGQPDEVLLVLDGTSGLNMLDQAREFNEAVPLTGIIVTKLDGTARGGAIVSVVDQLGIPVKFVGVGERVDDLQPFNPRAYVEALFYADE